MSLATIAMLTFRWDETKPVEDQPVLYNNAIHPPTLVHNMPTERKKALHLQEEGNALFGGNEF